MIDRVLLRRLGLACAVLSGSSLAAAGPAFADQLEVAADAPFWMHLGAGALLYAHIGGGTVGLVSGAAALLLRKGGKAHRLAGNIFLVSMLIMAGIGGVVAPFLNDPVSTVAGFVTCYLIFTGWLTGRRRAEGVSPFEIAGLFVALAGLASIATLAWMAVYAPNPAIAAAPVQAFYIFILVTTIAAASDLKLILRRGLTGAQRIARHVWRMCFGLFVATGSLFLGQAEVFPQWLQDTPVLYIAALAPLPFLLFWMLRVRLSKKYRGRAPASAAA